MVPALTANHQSVPRSEPKKPAADRFEIVDIDGRTHRPFDDSGAKAVVLVFLVSECPIANSYVPELNRISADYESRGVPLFIVQVDPQQTVESASEFAREYQLRPPLLLDREHTWVKMTGVHISPEAAVLSPAGELLYIGRIDDRYIGFGERRAHVTSSDLRRALDEILAGQPVSRPRVEAVGCDIPDIDS